MWFRQQSFVKEMEKESTVGLLNDITASPRKLKLTSLFLKGIIYLHFLDSWRAATRLRGYPRSNKSGHTLAALCFSSTFAFNEGLPGSVATESSCSHITPNYWQAHLKPRCTSNILKTDYYEEPGAIMRPDLEDLELHNGYISCKSKGSQVLHWQGSMCGSLVKASANNLSFSCHRSITRFIYLPWRSWNSFLKVNVPYDIHS